MTSFPYPILLFIVLQLFTTVSSTTTTASVHSLKIQTGTTPPHHGSSKLPFHHNVTLTVTLTVGTPPQPVTMVLDTGSELSWLHCNNKPLINTTTTTAAVFNPHLSNSYTPLPCTSTICKTRTHDFTIPATCDKKTNLCHASVSYADASSMDGTLSIETFNLLTPLSPIPDLVFGCMDSSTSTTISLEESQTTGLLGMNRGSLSFITQMNYPKFAYCISSNHNSAGVLLLGQASIPWLKPLRYTPLVKISTPLPYFDRVAYSIHLEGVKVGEKLLPLPKSLLEPDHTGAGQTMVDSGTQFTFLLGQVYTELRKEFLQQTKNFIRVIDDPDYAFQGVMDLCYRIPPLLLQKTLMRLPSVTLLFRGAEMSVSYERLLYRVPGEVSGSSVYCLTFGNSDLLGVESYIIGHHHQQNMWMEFDLENERVGLVEVRCDLASHKLGLGP